MMTPRPTTFLIISSIALLGGCSGSGEDVRVSLCKAIVSDLEGNGTPLEWQSVETHHGRFSDLEVRLSYVASDPAPVAASCTYEKEHIPEENVMHQADPLSTYRTRPSGISMADDAVTGARLRDAINNTIKRRADEFAGKVAEETQQAVAAARAGAEKALDGAREGAQKALMGLHDALEQDDGAGNATNGPAGD